MTKHAPLPRRRRGDHDGRDLIWVVLTIASIALVLSIMGYYGIKID